MLGFSFIQPRSKAFKHFLNRKKNIWSNGTEMVLNEKIFRIIEFPDMFLLKKHRASDSPNLNKIEKSPLSWNSLKCHLQAKNECREIALKRKSSLHKQTPPPNTFADSRQISGRYFIFRSPPVEISRYILSTQILVFLTFNCLTILLNFFQCWTSFN